MKHKEIIKPIDFKRLNTKRLLSYFRSERKKFDTYPFYCECCREPEWDNNPTHYGYLKDVHGEWVEYLNSIKSELATREHVENKKRG